MAVDRGGGIIDVVTPAIRPRHDGDLDDCVAVMAEVHGSDGYPNNWPADPRRFLTTADQLGAWVAVDEVGIAGHVMLCRGDTEHDELAGLDIRPEISTREGISRLFVAPRMRGRGVAAMLMAAAAAEAAKRNHGLILSVVDDGRDGAIGMYEHLGWRQIATLAANWTMTNGQTAKMRYYFGP